MLLNLRHLEINLLAAATVSHPPLGSFPSARNRAQIWWVPAMAIHSTLSSAPPGHTYTGHGRIGTVVYLMYWLLKISVWKQVSRSLRRNAAINVFTRGLFMPDGIWRLIGYFLSRSMRQSIAAMAGSESFSTVLLAVLSDKAWSLPVCEAASVWTGFAVGTTQLCLCTRTFKFGLRLMDALYLEQDAAAYQAFEKKKKEEGREKGNRTRWTWSNSDVRESMRKLCS